MSTLLPKADIWPRYYDVRFVPKADIATAKKHHSIMLDCHRIRPRIFNGGSRKGSKGNAVRALVDARNAVAAPATVSGESPADLPLRVNDTLGKAA
jgi:hypothetical protein